MQKRFNKVHKCFLLGIVKYIYNRFWLAHEKKNARKKNMLSVIKNVVYVKKEVAKNAFLSVIIYYTQGIKKNIFFFVLHTFSNYKESCYFSFSALTEATRPTAAYPPTFSAQMATPVYPQQKSVMEPWIVLRARMKRVAVNILIHCVQMVEPVILYPRSVMVPWIVQKEKTKR